jgi:hypothetical protein
MQCEPVEFIERGIAFMYFLMVNWILIPDQQLAVRCITIKTQTVESIKRMAHLIRIVLSIMGEHDNPRSCVRQVVMYFINYDANDRLKQDLFT